MLKRLLLGITFLLCPKLVAEDKASTASRPNVLFIITDDQGFSDFGFTGNKVVQTPNLDRLAAESALYKNFLVAAACSPSRSAFFTGRDHLTTGVWGVPPRANLRRYEARMPAFFKASGYRTMHIGKLDCVKVDKTNPTEFGWQDWVGGGGYEQVNPMLFSPKSSSRGEGWTVDLWTDRAVEFTQQKQQAPWFLSLAYIIPHLPWICDEKFSQPFLTQGLSKELAACYGSIAQMDAAIGRLLEELRKSGQDQRTIVVFVSDNGMTEQASDGALGSPKKALSVADWATRNMHHLAGHKALVWDNGIRVPLLVRWPGQIPAGERKQFGMAEDILPTMLDLAEIPTTVVPHLEWAGVSLGASLRNPSVVTEHHNAFRMAISGSGSPKSGVMEPSLRRFEDHHLILCGSRFKYHALPGGECALYDLESDPWEATDVQSRHPEVVAKLKSECRQRWEGIIKGGRSFAPAASGSKADE